MGKRGPKLWSPGSGFMPNHEIAKRLGISERAVAYNLASAYKKFKASNTPIPAIITWLHGVAEDPHPLIQATSAECQKEFVALWNHK